MPAIARVGDQVTHDQVRYGAITAGASRTVVEGAPVARVGDLAICPKHGPQPIASGSATVIVEGKPVARVGDTLACGATIVMGAGTVQAG
jgi:uncharacterized Zn-binding protein involved in type VI secretion